MNHLQRLAPRCLIAIFLFSVACADACEEDIDTPENQENQDNQSGPNLDIAPEFTEPGVYGGDECPQADLTADELNAGAVTTWTFSGVVTNAEGHGSFYIQSEDGQEIAGLIHTNPDDESYQFETPLFCGPQRMTFLWSNDACDLVVVKDIVTEDCDDPDIRITLLWDDLGQDWELHLIKEGGQINDPETDCTWNTCINRGPDWGVPGDENDDPRKDVDNTGILGPENITLNKPEDGTYTVMVEHWGNGDPASSGRVIFNIAGQPTSIVDLEGLAPRSVWTAGTIEWPSGEVTPSQDVYDCSHSWSGGCTAHIP